MSELYFEQVSQSVTLHTNVDQFGHLTVYVKVNDRTEGIIDVMPGGYKLNGWPADKQPEFHLAKCVWKLLEARGLLGHLDIASQTERFLVHEMPATIRNQNALQRARSGK